MTAVVVIELDDAAHQYIATCAREAGLPVALWLVIALEAQRCFEQATELVDNTESEVIAALNQAAALGGATLAAASNVMDSPALAQLRNYAAALSASATTAGSAPMVGKSVPLSPALHVAAAWALEADQLGLDVAAWASVRAAAQPVTRTEWEAASAAAGQTLAEWVLAQAVRWARSSSTSAHSPARR